ncbi:MAG: CidA/LrgA family protein [Paracoccus sp. (in: a-proteobacteria)]|uniref:CidA/LrgA family protein n=1 Tax=Paracoccus sp. TaxID=267 RepID=UPI0026E0F36A|nr:CidA/LrgA family protein [Paracoccus sp. (in: a-proteobacteria)]MDO5630874.1 CidA/LrgA family protein [Paracoccus sp. (in: a-proteobacteria)]
MLPALAIILGFQLAGEVISRFAGLPLPGPVLGLLLLVASCLIRPALADRLRPVAQGLLAHLSLFFVPAGVGVIAHLPLIRAHGVGLALALILSTVLAIGVGALVFATVARLARVPDDE